MVEAAGPRRQKDDEDYLWLLLEAESEAASSEPARRLRRPLPQPQAHGAARLRGSQGRRRGLETTLRLRRWWDLNRLDLKALCRYPMSVQKAKNPLIRLLSAGIPLGLSTTGPVHPRFLHARYQDLYCRRSFAPAFWPSPQSDRRRRATEPAPVLKLLYER